MENIPFEPSWTNGTNKRTVNGDTQQTQQIEAVDATDKTEDVDMVDGDRANGTSLQNGSNGEAVNGTEPATNGVSHDADAENGEGRDDASDTESQQTAHRMTTRARAQAASTPSPPQSPSSRTNTIHPLFLFSADSLPDRDLGLPPNEAEETRMVLMAYVQKQEEVARATTDLCNGLLQADRMRQDVFKWSKAEGHVGEMSDGEDWYDNEEWGLEQDLLKGRDEEDDDTAVAGKKSTRQRRKPDKEDR